MWLRWGLWEGDKPDSVEIRLGAQSRQSEPFGVARAVCFERLAGVFASRVDSPAMSPISQSRTGQEIGLFSGRRGLKQARGQEKGHYSGQPIGFKDD